MKLNILMLIIEDNQVLLLKRKNTNYMDGFYGLPAGKVEANETPLQALIRESYEELDIQVKPQWVASPVIGYREEEKIDFIDFVFPIKKYLGTIKNKEPHKCEDLRFFNLKNLPPQHVPLVPFFLEKVIKGVSYCEYKISNSHYKPEQETLNTLIEAYYPV